MSDGGQDASIIRVEVSISTAKAMNISDMSGMTCSGRVFTPPELLAWTKDKGKVKENVIEREKIGPVMNNETPIKKPTERNENFGKKEISAGEATKFLKIIQQSQFKVIKKLNKMLTKISLLRFLMHSEPHRKLLMKILNEAHVVMQSYPSRALDRRLRENWARDAREGPRVLMSLRVDFGPIG